MDKERGRNKCSNFELGFFVPNEAKNAGIAVAMTSIFNEVRGKKDKSKMSIYFFVVPKKTIQKISYGILLFSFLLMDCKKEACQPSPAVFELSVKKLGPLDTRINECSGFFYSQNQLFVINDGGGGAVLYQINPQNLSETKVIELQGVRNIDWEAITMTEEEIIIGDFGNNFGNRRDLNLLHFDKETYEFKKEIAFAFPNQKDFLTSDTHNFDCEALFVKEEQYHIFTKNRGNNNTNLYTSPMNTISFELQDSIEIPALVTDAYYYQSKQLLLLLSNQIELDKFESFLTIIQLADNSQLTLLANLPLNINEQLEAITLKENNVFFIGSEKERDNGGNLYEVSIEGL